MLMKLVVGCWLVVEAGCRMKLLVGLVGRLGGGSWAENEGGSAKEFEGAEKKFSGRACWGKVGPKEGREEVGLGRGLGEAARAPKRSLLGRPLLLVEGSTDDCCWLTIGARGREALGVESELLGDSCCLSLTSFPLSSGKKFLWREGNRC